MSVPPLPASVPLCVHVPGFGIRTRTQMDAVLAGTPPSRPGSHERRGRTPLHPERPVARGAPYCALFTAQRTRAAEVRAIAVLSALVLALPAGIWATTAQLTLTAAVLLVAMACTWAAGLVWSETGREGAAAPRHGWTVLGRRLPPTHLSWKTGRT